MPAELYANAAASTLNGGINNSVTSLIVTNATGFPTGTGQFRILIDSEILIVTGVSGTTFTVTRAAEGSAAASHSNAAGVTHITTAASIKRVSEMNFQMGTKPIGKTKSVTVENHTVAASTTYTACNLSGLGPGYIASMWMAVNCSDSVGRENSLLKIYRDGAGSPDISNTMAGMHGFYYGAAAFNSRWIGSVAVPNVGSATGVSYMNRFIIPFTDGFKVTLTNASASATSEMYLNLQYVLTPNQFDWGRMARFCTKEQNLTNLTKYSTQNLINQNGRGVFFGLYQVINDTDADFHVLEGNHLFTIDSEGSPSITSSGTEDYYENAGYFSGGVMIGPSTGTVVKTSTAVGAYRFHDLDPIAFDTNLTLDWQVGDVAEATMASNLNNLIYTVYYYLDQ